MPLSGSFHLRRGGHSGPRRWKCSQADLAPTDDLHIPDRGRSPWRPSKSNNATESPAGDGVVVAGGAAPPAESMPGAAPS